MVGKPAEFMLENIAHKFNLRREQVTRPPSAGARAGSALAASTLLKLQQRSPLKL